MEEVKIQGGKVLNACREVQIQVLIYHYYSGFGDAVGDVEMLAGRFRYRC